MLSNAKKHFDDMVDHVVGMYKSSARFTRALAKELPRHRQLLHNKLDDALDYLEANPNALDVDEFDAEMDYAGAKIKANFAEVIDV